MDLYVAEQFAKESLAEYSQKYDALGAYRFAWNNSTRSLGRCSYMKREISLSRVLVPAITEELKVVDTVLHEFAHAIIGPGFKHGVHWKNMAKNLGAIPKPCFDLNAVADISKVTRYNWYKVCPNCTQAVGFVRMPNRATACSTCCDKHNFGKYDQKFRLVLVPGNDYRGRVNNGIRPITVVQ